jgi:uncharacterized membrane protein YhaH (DUF805 family)
MTLQQWCFSYRGRLGRRDFWIWQAVWLLTTTLLFVLAGNDLLDTQMAAFGVVCLLWPASAVLVKRLHDRNRPGYWAFLVIVAWMLVAGNWSMLDGVLSWLVGRAIPFIIFVGLLLDLGLFRGTAGKNRFGAAALPVRYKPATYQ